MPPTISSNVNQLVAREISATVTRLMLHYWNRDEPPSIRAAQTEDWLEDLIEFGPEVVRDVCRDWRRANPDKRPGPGHIRQLCIEERESRQLKLEVRRELTEPERIAAAEEWAKVHGFADLAEYFEQGGGPVWVGSHRFEAPQPAVVDV